MPHVGVGCSQIIVSPHPTQLIAPRNSDLHHIPLPALVASPFTHARDPSVLAVPLGKAVGKTPVSELHRG